MCESVVYLPDFNDFKTDFWLTPRFQAIYLGIGAQIPQPAVSSINSSQWVQTEDNAISFAMESKGRGTLSILNSFSEKFSSIIPVVVCTSILWLLLFRDSPINTSSFHLNCSPAFLKVSWAPVASYVKLCSKRYTAE